MGRGRAKAKQTRVARDLKYRDVGTDLSQLANELRKTGGPAANGHTPEVSEDTPEEEDDPYAAYSTYGDDDDAYDSEDDGGAHRSHHRQS
jgi:hypothetical protein